MALRIAPPSSHSTTASNTHSFPQGAPSAPGVHDTLRSRLSINQSLDSHTATFVDANEQLQSTHPLESRLRNWQKTEETLKSNLLRRQFGLGEPLRRGMEIKVCKEAEWRPQCLGGSSRLGQDILAGKDTYVTWDDIFDGSDIGKEGEVQAQIERMAGV